ncbi:MAG: hypothetical protein ABSD70_09255 [Terracidiphilus sp.]|jgi:hypothetical protein
MSWLARRGAWLMPLLLSGCIFHKTRPAPILPLAPVIGPSRPIELISVELPPNQTVITAKPVYNMREEAVSIKQPVRHHKPRPPEETEMTVNSAASVSAIGELSSADPAYSRLQAEDSIAAVERGLNGINRQLDDGEQKTAAQIHEFLKQAKEALASGDLDGTHTLTEKARALLAELTK